MSVVRRVIPWALGIAVVVVGVVVLLSSGTAPPHYRIVLDNAFGLTSGADLRVAGVKVGQVADLDVQRSTDRALVTVDISRTDFGRLHANATCRVQPQSLIGEYFLNCAPGTSRRYLNPNGGMLPVSQTSGTIPPDLVLNIMQMPERQRLGIILTELGAGLAARGPALNATIRRAVPALQDTNRVLALLAGERRTLAGLTRDADTVLTRVGANSGNVARFVSNANAAAQASATEHTALAGTIQRLPRFLTEVRPVLRDLGIAAADQTPAMRDLRLSAPSATVMIRRLGQFATASQPALTALGAASATGTPALKAAQPTIAAVRDLAAQTKEPATNLRFVGEHLDDRRFAVEPNPQSPGGKGFTGLEAFLQYPFVQSQAVNIFDSRGYLLKLNAMVTQCSRYFNAQSARANPSLRKTCSGALGPSAPGVTSDVASSASTRSPHRASKRSARRGGANAGGSGAGPSAPATSQAPSTPALPALPSVPSVPAPGVPGGTPATPPAPAPGGTNNNATQTLLGYLLGQ